ncbi:unnamed protein product [Nezara viridula]|uniref:Uncharacterized protein n=1 Tax=Nezara viridula TaxID=85310 RepID=A0A9P0HHZ5_NEZVI|nr:unnamed protein product [Nezara viridula]
MDQTVYGLVSKRGRPPTDWDKEMKKTGGAAWKRVALERKEWKRMGPLSKTAVIPDIRRSLGRAQDMTEAKPCRYHYISAALDKQLPYRRLPILGSRRTYLCHPSRAAPRDVVRCGAAWA